MRVLVGVEPSDNHRRVAFERLYAAYRSRLYGFLYRLAGARDRADDLFQETWLKVARSAHLGQRIEDEAAWLFTVARNVFLSERRSSATQDRGAAALKQAPAQAQPSPERILEGHQEAAGLEAALSGLAEDDRAILWLVAVEGLDQQQVATVLDIGYAAVRQRLARARARLGERMEQHRAGPPRKVDQR